MVKRLVSRFFFAASLAVIAASACSKSDTTAPATGTLVFKIDPLTCTGSDLFTFYIDGTAQNNVTLAAGGSQGYTVSAGSHAIGAKANISGKVFTGATVIVPANGTFTELLACV